MRIPFQVLIFLFFPAEEQILPVHLNILLKILAPNDEGFKIKIQQLIKINVPEIYITGTICKFNCFL